METVTTCEHRIESLNNRGVVLHGLPWLLFTGWARNGSAVPALRLVRQMFARLGVDPRTIDHDHRLVRLMRAPMPRWDEVERCLRRELRAAALPELDHVPFPVGVVRRLYERDSALGAWWHLLVPLAVARDRPDVDRAFEPVIEFLIAHCDLDRRLVHQRCGTAGDKPDQALREAATWLCTDTESLTDDGQTYLVSRLLYWTALFEVVLDTAAGVEGANAPGEGSSSANTSAEVDQPSPRDRFPEWLPVAGENGLQSSLSRFLGAQHERWETLVGDDAPVCRSARAKKRRRHGVEGQWYEDLARLECLVRSWQGSRAADDERSTRAIRRQVKDWCSGARPVDHDTLCALFGIGSWTLGRETLSFVRTWHHVQVMLLVDGHAPQEIVDGFAAYPIHLAAARRRFEHFESTGKLVAL